MFVCYRVGSIVSCMESEPIACIHSPGVYIKEVVQGWNDERFAVKCVGVEWDELI